MGTMFGVRMALPARRRAVSAAVMSVAALFAAQPGRSGFFYGANLDSTLEQNRSALGPELATVSTVTGVPIGGAVLNQYATGASVVAGKYYFISAKVRGYQGAGTVGFTTGPVFGNNANVNYVNVNGFCHFQGVATASGPLTLFTRDANTATFADISVREVVDWSKLVKFDDPNGTVPVFSEFQTARGLGLLLDQSKGLVRGPELIAGNDLSGFVDALSTTHTPTTMATSSVGGILSTVLVVGRWYALEVLGSTTATEFSVNTGNSSPVPNVRTVIRTGFGQCIFKADNPHLYLRNGSAGTTTITSLSVRELPGNHYVQPTATARGELSRRYNGFVDTDNVTAVQSVGVIAGVSVVLSFEGSGTMTIDGGSPLSAGTHVITPGSGGVRTYTPSGQVLNASFMPQGDWIALGGRYQWVRSATDYDTSGFPLHFRTQTDDSGATYVDPGLATKVVLAYAGQRFTAVTGMILESSPSSSAYSGTVALFGSSTLFFRSRGFVSADVGVPNPPGDRFYAIAEGSRLSDYARLMVNGVSSPEVVTDQSGAEYTPQAVNLFSRAGTGNFFNGRTLAMPMALFMQEADPGLTVDEMAQLRAIYAAAAGVTA